MRFPNSVDELISALDELYPEVVAQPGDDPQAIMHAALQRGVVQSLKLWRARPHEAAPVVRRRGAGRNVSSFNAQS